MSEQPTLSIPSQQNGSEATGGSVRELVDGQPVDGVFAVRERERRSKRDGGEWLRLVIGDRSGTVEAVAWDGIDEAFEAAAPGRAVRIAGRFSVHARYGPKVTIDSVRPAAETEFEAADLAEGPPVPPERLEADLRDLIETIQSPDLRSLLDCLLRPGLADVAALPRRPGGQALPPGLPPRAPRPHAVGRPGRRAPPRRPSPASTATSPSPARCSTTSARPRPTTTTRSRSTSPTPAACTARSRSATTSCAAQIERIEGFDAELAPGRAAHHPVPPRRASRTARRWSRARARRRSSTRSTTSAASSAASTGSSASLPDGRGLVAVRPRHRRLGLLRVARGVSPSSASAAERG